jgi:hypothetical protein
VRESGTSLMRRWERARLEGLGGERQRMYAQAEAQRHEWRKFRSDVGAALPIAITTAAVSSVISVIATVAVTHLIG